MPKAKGKRKQKYRPRKSSPCWCFVCAGQSVDTRTLKDHNARPRSTQVTIVVDSKQALPGSLEVAEPEDPRPVITQATHALLAAYDEYFLDTFRDAGESLYSDTEEREEGDVPPTVANMVMMHLDWMSTFHNSGDRV
jgi:hypothetical protein